MQDFAECLPWEDLKSCTASCMPMPTENRISLVCLLDIGFAGVAEWDLGCLIGTWSCAEGCILGCKLWNTCCCRALVNAFEYLSMYDYSE